MNVLTASVSVNVLYITTLAVVFNVATQFKLNTNFLTNTLFPTLVPIVVPIPIYISNAVLDYTLLIPNAFSAGA